MATASRSALPAGAADALRAVLGSRLRLDEPLAAHISLGVGGPADAFCAVGDERTLRATLDLLAARGIPLLMLGRGTNLVPADEGFRGAAIRLEGEFGAVAVDPAGPAVEAGASAALAALVERSMGKDLGGLEFTTGIPGVVGGSLAGNAGTATESLGDAVERVDLVVPGGAPRSLVPAELEFGYRTSGIRATGGVVVRARFRLVPRARAEVAARVRGFTDKRREQPLTLPNVGCIFKNPPGESAGRLIDRAGLKGERVGGVEVSTRHANFMVGRGGARAADVRELIDRVRARVHEASGILLEPEVIVLDELGRRVASGEAAC